MEWWSWICGYQDVGLASLWWVRRVAESLGYIATAKFVYSTLFPKKKPQRKTQEVKRVKTREYQIL
jgi:hypothetical protein